MSEYIAFDSHKRYSLEEREDVASGKIVQQVRLTHAPGAVRRYLARCTPGTAVALEATGNWYWIVEEIEQAGLQPRLVHPRKAKLMMGLINKTDKLDVHGLNRLQRNGTLPTVWIPPRPLRDLRELTRTRLVPAFPPSVVVQVKALACELPYRLGLPLSRLSLSEIQREVITQGIVGEISGSTLWRWLSADALRPWRHRSWIFPRDLQFAEKAGRILDL